MAEYEATHAKLPSATPPLSSAAESFVSSPNHMTRPWYDLSDWLSSRYDRNSGGSGFPHTSQYQTGTNPYLNDEETILDGLLKVSFRRRDIIVVPVGKKEFIPEKYWPVTIELEESYGYAVIK
jgi:hypothetical protein